MMFFFYFLYCAGVPGLEPRLTEPESAGLPITPYPNNFLALGGARQKFTLRKWRKLQRQSQRNTCEAGLLT